MVAVMNESSLITKSEQVSNEHVISTIADETHKPVPLVKQIYEEEFTYLRATARIVEYVALFATRHTKEILNG